MVVCGEISQTQARLVILKNFTVASDLFKKNLIILSATKL